MNRFRPHFSIRTLASFGALVAFSTWWVTWPERTAATLVRLLSEARFNELSRMMATESDRSFIAGIQEMVLSQPKITDYIREDRTIPPVLPLERSWSDVLLGRGSFDMGGICSVSYSVRRGRVSFDSLTPPISNPPIGDSDEAKWQTRLDDTSAPSGDGQS